MYRIFRDRTGLIASAFAFLLASFFLRFTDSVTSGEVIRYYHDWFPSLGIGFSFIVDGLSLTFSLLITIIGGFVFAYSSGYMKGIKNTGRYYLYILMFMTSMLGVVNSDNLVTLFVFWELTSITSYLLIGFKNEDKIARAAALQALLVTVAGGLALLAGIVLIGFAGGSYEFTELLKNAETLKNSRMYLPVLVLFLTGAFTKSAQFPFHFWLPGAMEAPTPVSAYLHSATMVTAGVFLLARMNPILGDTTLWYYAVTSVGAITMLVGAGVAILQTDLKRILAYSTVSALGTMVLLIGIGTKLAVMSAMLFLIVHSLYKGGLFLVAGAVDHSTGTRDIDRLGGIFRLMPLTGVSAILAALSMAGFAPFIGFISKELFYESTMNAPDGAALITAVAVVSNIFMVVIACLLTLKTFFSYSKRTPHHPHEVSVSMLAGMIALGFAGLVFGIIPSVSVTPLLTSAASAVTASPVSHKLYLWHGLNTVLILGITTILLGILSYLLIAKWPVHMVMANSRLLKHLRTGYLYDSAINLLNQSAYWQTRIIQNGRLNLYIITIALTTVSIAGFTLIYKSGLSADFNLDIRLYELIVMVPVIAGALLVVTTTSRLMAVASLGVVGYGVALIFILYGAPDLAITQFTIETLTVIIFVLAVYRLPRFSTFSERSARIRDAAISVIFGGVMTALLLSVPSEPFSSSLREYFAQNSYLMARGRNVVNVILVDFRVIDTLGETVVLSVAAIGIFALLKLVQDLPFEKRQPRIMLSGIVSTVLSTTTTFLLPLLILFSVFLLLRGHNEAGGGFVGGLVAASSFTLYAIANGVEIARQKLMVQPRTLITTGLLTMVASGLVSLTSGMPFMTGTWIDRSIPFIGKVGTPTFFDLGVYLVVAGVTLMIVFSLSEEEEQ